MLVRCTRRCPASQIGEALTAAGRSRATQADSLRFPGMGRGRSEDLVGADADQAHVHATPCDTGRLGADSAISMRPRNGVSECGTGWDEPQAAFRAWNVTRLRLLARR